MLESWASVVAVSMGISLSGLFTFQFWAPTGLISQVGPTMTRTTIGPETSRCDRG